jgi:hypothetical protein
LTIGLLRMTRRKGASGSMPVPRSPSGNEMLRRTTQAGCPKNIAVYAAEKIKWQTSKNMRFAPCYSGT